MTKQWGHGGPTDINETVRLRRELGRWRADYAGLTLENEKLCGLNAELLSALRHVVVIHNAMPESMADRMAECARAAIARAEGK